MESEIQLKTLRKNIFDAINGICIPSYAEEHFLTIMSIRMGQSHEVYKKFEQILACPDLQWEMLEAPENHKLKSDFDILCHVVIKSYFENTRPKNEEDTLLAAYFAELEKQTNKQLSLFSFSQIKHNFTKLQSLEEKVADNILAAERKHEPDQTNCRLVLSVWLMYPEAVYNLPRAKRIVKSFALQSCCQ